MHGVVYGAPLPPGLDATTKGELRIRIEKIILDDATVNHSAYIHWGNAVSSSRVLRHNKFEVPIDYCCVSPLFWGEPKPSARCQPATPRMARGSVTMVYPVKVREEGFGEYLRNMTRSAHNGLQLEVYVPANYSGRRAVLVGKSVIALDQLTSAGSGQVEGWFTIGHYAARPEDVESIQETVTESEAAVAGSVGTSLRGGAGRDEMHHNAAPLVIPIGKMKIHIQLVYFAKSVASAKASVGGSASGGFTRRGMGVMDAMQMDRLRRRPHAAQPAGLNTSHDPESEYEQAAGGSSLQWREESSPQNKSAASTTTTTKPPSSSRSSSSSRSRSRRVDLAEANANRTAAAVAEEATLPTTSLTATQTGCEEQSAASASAPAVAAAAHSVSRDTAVSHPYSSPSDRLPKPQNHASHLPSNPSGMTASSSAHNPPAGMLPDAADTHPEAAQATASASSLPGSAYTAALVDAAAAAATGGARWSDSDDTLYTSESSDAERRLLAAGRRIRQGGGASSIMRERADALLRDPSSYHAYPDKSSHGDYASESHTNAERDARINDLATRYVAEATNQGYDPMPMMHGCYDLVLAGGGSTAGVNGVRGSSAPERHSGGRLASTHRERRDNNAYKTSYHVTNKNSYVNHNSAHAAVTALASVSPLETEDSAELIVGAAAVVELVFTDFSFTASEVTRDLREIRITVRLSRGITIGTPTAGPLSSYIHRIPLEQPSICMSFGIRSYTAESSRLVIEVVKVTSRPRQRRGTYSNTNSKDHTSKIYPNDTNFGSIYDEDDDAHDDTMNEGEEECGDSRSHSTAARRMREVVGEELLGLAIVPLFTQSRRLILRDPVHNVNNVHLHLQLRLRPHSGAATSVDALSETDCNSKDDHGKNNNDTTSASLLPLAAKQKKRGVSECARGVNRADSIAVLGDDEEPRANTRHGSHPHPRSHHHRRVIHGAAETTYNDDVVGAAKSEGRHGAGVSSLLQHSLLSSSSNHDTNDGNHAKSMQRRRSTSAAHTHNPALARSPSRFYFAVHIYSAKELPLVVMSEAAHGTSPNGPALTSPAYTHTHAPLSVSESRRLHRPNSFLVVEDIFSGVDNTLANTGPVSDWFVHEVRGAGVYDRTAVVYDSQKPEYDYACVISMPRESVFLRHGRSIAQHTHNGGHSVAQEQEQQDRDALSRTGKEDGGNRTETMHPTSNGVGNSAETTAGGCSAEKPCLRELLLTLWHYAPARAGDRASTGVQEKAADSSAESLTLHAQYNSTSHAAPSASSAMPGTSEAMLSSGALSANPTNSGDRQVGAQDEMSFWSRAAFIGSSTIDLRPLRYLSRLDGYYRVVSSSRVPEGCQAALSTPVGQTVGYVRVSVQPL